MFLLKNLVICLIGLEAFPPVYKSPNQPLFKDLQPMLHMAVDLADVWLLIKPYCSFFNFYIIEHITNFLGTDDDKQKMSSYQNAFLLYIEHRVYECPAEFNSLNNSDCTIFVKLDESYDDCTAKQLISFKNKLCDIFEIAHDGVLRLCKVEQGCYELTFQAPVFIKDIVFPLSLQQEAALKKLRILWLLCGDYEFYARRKQSDVS